jgi:hypothetical protein
MRLLFVFCVLFSFLRVEAQGILSTYEDTLIHYQKSLDAFKTDRQKIETSIQMKALLERALNSDKSFEYPFDSLTEIGRIYAPDRTFRILNWDIALSDGTHRYFGFIQSYNPKKNIFSVYPLTDKSSEFKNAENTVGDPGKWYGMLYYKIIPVKTRGRKYYTLFGFHPQDKLTTKKIIDILYFNPDGSPRFGADLFRLEKKSPKRVIFEYSAQVVMSLKYNEETRRIVFDHLSPSEPRLEGQFQYYGPDFSTDALEFKKGKWVYFPDVDARNKSNQKDVKYNDPKDKTKDYENKQFYQPKN